MANKFWTIEQIAVLVQTNRQAALRGCVAIFKRQTMDERLEKGTKYHNRLGFSKKHVTRGSEIALKVESGKNLSAEDIADAHAIAYAYREQLWMIAQNAVPENNMRSE